MNEPEQSADHHDRLRRHPSDNFEFGFRNLCFEFPFDTGGLRLKPGNIRLQLRIYLMQIRFHLMHIFTRGNVAERQPFDISLR
jgi:hypothetical protein